MSFICCHIFTCVHVWPSGGTGVLVQLSWFTHTHTSSVYLVFISIKHPSFLTHVLNFPQPKTKVNYFRTESAYCVSASLCTLAFVFDTSFPPLATPSVPPPHHRLPFKDAALSFNIGNGITGEISKAENKRHVRFLQMLLLLNH